MIWKARCDRKSAAVWIVICVAYLIQAIGRAAGQECGPPEVTPQERCQQLDGFINGGRCFFESFYCNPSVAWGICHTAAGATLAQIHTQSEFDAFVAKGFRGWLALRHYNNDGSSTDCEFEKANTFWYDNETTPNLQMTAGNTWVKYHICGELDADLAAEFDFLFDADTSTLKDWNVGAYALCQFNTLVQNYQKTNICMAETPFAILALSNPQTAVQQCADQCTLTMWCRSFNIIHNPANCNSLTCQLFSWSVLDTCPKCANTTPAPADGSCVHYNYVP